MKRTLGVLACCVTLGVSGLALADVPPPGDQKYVSYGFRVDGGAKFPDRVIVVYPWSTSNGAPSREVTVAEDGKPVSVGRRSAPPVLYAVKRDAWEAFAKTLPPDAHDLESVVPPFLATSGIQCNKQPSMQSVLPKSDPRDEIVEAFQVKTIDDKTCDLGGAEAAPAEPPASDKRAASEPNEGAPPKGGCAGCATASDGVTGGYGLAALALGMLMHLRRKKMARGIVTRPE